MYPDGNKYQNDITVNVRSKRQNGKKFKKNFLRVLGKEIIARKKTTFATRHNKISTSIWKHRESGNACNH